MSSLARRLRQVVGDPHLLIGEAAEQFTHDATFMAHDLEAVVRPPGTEEVAALGRARAEEGTRSRGAGPTSLVTLL